MPHGFGVDRVTSLEPEADLCRDRLRLIARNPVTGNPERALDGLPCLRQTRATVKHYTRQPRQRRRSQLVQPAKGKPA